MFKRLLRWIVGTSKSEMLLGELSYWQTIVESFKRSFSRTWIIFGAASTLMPDAVSVMQKFLTISWLDWVSIYQSELRLAIAAVIAILYLTYAPYKIQKEQVRLLLSKTDALNTEIVNLRQRARTKTETLLGKAVDMIRDSEKYKIVDHFIEPIGAIVALAEELHTEEEVEALCNAFRKHYGSDPFFEIIDCYENLPKDFRLNFIKSARYNTEIRPIKSHRDVVQFIEMFWGSEHGLQPRNSGE